MTAKAEHPGNAVFMVSVSDRALDTRSTSPAVVVAMNAAALRAVSYAVMSRLRVSLTSAKARPRLLTGRPARRSIAWADTPR